MQEQKWQTHEIGEALEDELNTELSAEEIQQRYEDNLAEQALDQTSSILRKNRREIERLNKHAQVAVLENNYQAYAYAIRKLRGIYRQPFTEEMIYIGWQTTRKTVWEIINDKVS